MKQYGPYATVGQVVHLVLHERDEWGDYYGHSFKHECRHLKREALAAPGGEQSEGVVSGEHGVDYLFLHGPELVIAPILLQDT